MEEIIRRLEIERGDDSEASLAHSASTDDDGGKNIEEQALLLTSEEIYEESGRRRFEPRANNAEAPRMGEVILIVDSDTIVREVSCSQIELGTGFQC